MRWVHKNCLRKTVPFKSRRAKVASWIDSSPTKKIIVALAAILAFVISAANTAWTGYKEYQQASARATIKIRSRTSYPLWTSVSMDELLGHSFSDPEFTSQQSPRIKTPYFPVVLEIHNPMGKKSSLSDCRLRIRFYERNGEHESFGYMTEEVLKSRRVQELPIVTIDSGSTVRVEWLFFFPLTPQLKALLADKTTQAFRFQVQCDDEAQHDILSKWR